MKAKILIITALMLIFVCIFSTSISANEGEATNPTPDASNDTGDCLPNTVVGMSGVDTVTDGANEPTLKDDVYEDDIVKNVFEMLFDEVTKYLSEILCFLTFISSIIIAFAYKKGLIPLVEGGLSTLNRVVTRLKEDSAESDRATKDNYDQLSSRVVEYEKEICTLKDKINDLTLALSPLGEELKNNELIEQLIVSQTNMLYDVFMASSLPAYQKERVETHFKKMMEDMENEK